MLKLQINELCLARGIKKPLTELKKSGISYQVSFNYLHNTKKQLALDHIEKLCFLLKCTPNDLLAWTPDNQSHDTTDNPLQSIRANRFPDVSKILNSLTLEELKNKLST